MPLIIKTVVSIVQLGFDPEIWRNNLKISRDVRYNVLGKILKVLLQGKATILDFAFPFPNCGMSTKQKTFQTAVAQKLCVPGDV